MRSTPRLIDRAFRTLACGTVWLALMLVLFAQGVLAVWA